MHAYVISAAIVAVALSASDAEARARVKFRPSSSVSVVPSPARPVAATAPTRDTASGVVPAALVGAAIGSRRARAGDDPPTGSMRPAPLTSPGTAPADAASAGKSAPKAKPVFVCASDRTFGGGLGFCQLN